MTDAEAIKRELKCYSVYVRDLRKAEQKLDGLWYRLTGVHGISYDKIPSTFNPEAVEESKLELLEDIEEARDEIRRCVRQIQHVNGIIDSFEDQTKEAVIAIYVKGKRYTDIARAQFMSKSGLEGRINRAIAKYLQGQK